MKQLAFSCHTFISLGFQAGRFAYPEETYREYKHMWKISYCLLSPPAHSPVRSSPVQSPISTPVHHGRLERLCKRQDKMPGGWIGLFIWIQYFNPYQAAVFNVLHWKSSVTSEKCTFICTKEKYKLCDGCSQHARTVHVFTTPIMWSICTNHIAVPAALEGSFCPVVHSDLAFYRWTWQWSLFWPVGKWSI